MKLTDINDSLPNGFHDSIIDSVSVDYGKRSLRFDINVWIGDMSSIDEKRREAYRRGVLKIYDFEYFIVEPPNESYPYKKEQQITIDGGDYEKKNIKTSVTLPRTISEGLFRYWFFVYEWNSFIHIAAKNAELIFK